MPYGNNSQDEEIKAEADALHTLIREVVESVKDPQSTGEYLSCIRGDRHARPGEIVTGLVAALVEAEIAIAVLTGQTQTLSTNSELGMRLPATR